VKEKNMALIKARSITRSGANEQDATIKALLSGELSVANWVQIQSLKGRVFCVNAGTVTTPITWDASGTIAVTKPIIWLSVPAETTVIPVYYSLYMEAFGTNAQFECNLTIGTGGSRTSGGTAVIPANLRTDMPQSSACTAYRGDNSPVFVGATANVSEIFRHGAQFAITKTAGSATVAATDPNKFEWRLADGLYLPIAKGSAQIAAHQGSQAGTGFATLIYVEIPSSELPV
jgi:hypothetical protein